MDSGKAVQTLTEQETPIVAPPVNTIASGYVNRAVGVCCWFYLLAILSAWAILYTGDSWWAATLLLFGPRWVCALPVIPLFIAAMMWRRRALLPVLLALLFVLGPLMGFQVPWRFSSRASNPGLRLRVMTCNLHYQEPNKSDIERFLAESTPDIVAMQEMPTSEPFEYFDASHEHVVRTGRLLLASHFPIRKVERLGRKSMQVPGLLNRYELETPAGIVVIYSLHFASPREGLYIASRRPDAGSDELEDNSTVRLRQSEHVARLANAETSPVLLMGDFNTPSESVIFRRVWNGYSDAFVKAGWGWGYTFFGGKTAVRIDHILADPTWHCERCWVGPSVGSPHHPVVADLILREASR